MPVVMRSAAACRSEYRDHWFRSFASSGEQLLHFLSAARFTPIIAPASSVTISSEFDDSAAFRAMSRFVGWWIL